MIARDARNATHERRRAAARRWLDEVTAATGDPAAVFDSDSTVLVVANETFAAQLGTSVSELIGLSAAAVTPESEVAPMRRRIRRILRGELQQYQAVRTFQRSDGSRFKSVVHVRAIGSPGEPVELVGLRSHRLVQAEPSAAEFVERLAPLFEDAADAVAVCGRDGLVRSAWGNGRRNLVASGNLFAIVESSRRSVLAELLAGTTERLSFSDVALEDGRTARVYVSPIAGEPDTVVVRIRHAGPHDLPDESGPVRQTAMSTIDHIAGVLWSSGLVEFPAVPQNDTRTLPLGQLSEKERRVLFAVLRNQPVASIARDMYVSPSTVRNHLSSIYAKFGVRSRIELLELMRDRA